LETELVPHETFERDHAFWAQRRPFCSECIAPYLSGAPAGHGRIETNGSAYVGVPSPLFKHGELRGFALEPDDFEFDGELLAVLMSGPSEISFSGRC